jgi:Na+/H+ antiporter NhaD/arsenite permease-like protein
VCLEPLARDRFFWLLAVVLAGYLVAYPGRIVELPNWVDWDTIAALAGLLVLTKAVELSHALELLASHLLRRVSTQRQLAFILIGAAALLSMFITNDVALFAVVPLTLTLRSAGDIPVAKLVVFEALAVNAGSALTPMGNPQNLFLWQHFSIPFGQFVWQQLPMCLIGLVLLGALTSCAFSAKVADTSLRPSAALDTGLLATGLALYAPFLILNEMHKARFACLGVFLVFALRQRRILAAIDWPLLVVFVLIFIDMRCAAGSLAVQNGLAHLDLADPHQLYWMAIGLSQCISNVPAAILLPQFSSAAAVIAAGVNIGGYGLAIGSLANLIALRQLGEKGAATLFHVFSIPFLVANAVLVYSWLLLR